MFGVGSDTNLFSRFRLGQWLDRWHGLLMQRGDMCLACNQRSAKSARPLALCSACEASVAWIGKIQCTRCGRAEHCHDCIRRPAGDTYYVKNRSAVRYTAVMKEWLAAYKYRGHEKMAVVMAQMLSAPYQRLLAEQRVHNPSFTFHAVSFVPLSAERMAERGFNQAEQMALRVGHAHGLPVVPILHRVQHTERLSHKSRADRSLTMATAFAQDPAAIAALQRYAQTVGRMNILMIDDVYTTGSTMNYAARSITSSLYASVYGLTWAR